MEEVDNIIIHSLREIGCEIDDEVKSLKQFGPHDVVTAVLTCLRTIDTAKGWPKLMPRHMSQKVSLCSDIAKTIKDELGYKDDQLGYHQFLYPAENDTRKLLRFMIEQLPETDSRPEEEEDVSILNRSIKAELQAAMHQKWSPTARRQNYKETYVLQTGPILSAFVPGPKSGRNAGLEKYIRNYLDFITAQPPSRQDVVPSVLEHNLVAFVEEKEREEEWAKLGAESGLHPLQYKQKKLAGINKKMSEALRASMVSAGKSASAKLGSESLQDILMSLEYSGRMKGRSKFGREVKFNRPEQAEEVKSETDEELTERRRKEIEELDNTIFGCRSEAEQLEKAIATFTSNLRQMEANALLEDQKKKELEKKYLVCIKRSIFSRMPKTTSSCSKVSATKHRKGWWNSQKSGRSTGCPWWRSTGVCDRYSSTRRTNPPNCWRRSRS